MIIDSGVSEALATLTTPFIIVAYKFLAPLYGSDGPVVIDGSKLIGPVKTSGGLWTMCIASIWTGFGRQDQWSGPLGTLDRHRSWECTSVASGWKMLESLASFGMTDLSIGVPEGLL